jgi:hypothetical protein
VQLTFVTPAVRPVTYPAATVAFAGTLDVQFACAVTLPVVASL